MIETTRTTYIRTDSEIIEETLLVNNGQTSTLQPRIYRKRTESYSRTEARSEDTFPRHKVLTFLKIMLYLIRNGCAILA